MMLLSGFAPVRDHSCSMHNRLQSFMDSKRHQMGMEKRIVMAQVHLEFKMCQVKQNKTRRGLFFFLF